MLPCLGPVNLTLQAHGDHHFRVGSLSRRPAALARLCGRHYLLIDFGRGWHKFPAANTLGRWHDSLIAAVPVKPTAAQAIPVHIEINDMHAATGYEGRTDLSFLHVFSLSRGCETVRAVMPPHRRGFYQVSLLGVASGVSVAVNLEEQEAATDLLVFVHPHKVLSWARSDAQAVFVIYFKPEFLDSFGRTTGGSISLLSANVGSYSIGAPDHESAPLVLLRTDLRFQRLVDRNFLIHRTVAAYARLLKISPGHLSDVVKQLTGRSASVLIANRMLQEAKLLLAHSDIPIVELSSPLRFSEPTHFARFFKKASKMTLLQFRDSGYSDRNPG